MSLVAYDSSDDSERDDPSPEPRSSAKPGGLFTSLPAPKRSEPAVENQKPGPELLRAKKRSEPVRINVPEIRAESSDEDEDEPVRKKVGSRGGALSSLLPQPKHLSVKETQRPLVPHTLTKRPAPAAHAKGTKPASQGVSGTSPSPSAIKAAAKSASLQFARQIAADEEGSDDELAPENYFSLSESSSEPVAAASYPDPQPYTPSLQPSPLNSEDAPLDFSSGAESQPRPAWVAQEYHTADYQPDDHKPSAQDYYSEGFYPEQNSGLGEQEEAESSTLFNDEAFRRLQGKQNRGKEEIKFLEIKGDDQLSGHQQWMMKNMTTETEPRRSFSKKKGDQPTGQQRRKHQITYLIHQAKERELELKNSWSDNKLSRRQTQAKYGF
ncbi:proline-rich protein PRCC [Ictalurus furcatus]|uniref:proline-rich protein PRCC n=1 Tax=Ictalurus furcatus TaxID=66913 RepID=UPI00235091D7|nr:proline-rich protein PRCC [Ictalurus furcatus]